MQRADSPIGDMSRTEIDEYVSGIKTYAEDTIRHCINGIGDNARHFAEVLAADMFADMPTVNNAHGLYAAFEEIESGADCFCDNYVFTRDWTANVSDAELFELLDYFHPDIDEYADMLGVEKYAGESFTEHVVRVVQWWYQDTIANGCKIAAQSIRDRLQALMLELEEQHGDENGVIPDKAL